VETTTTTTTTTTTAPSDGGASTTTTTEPATTTTAAPSSAVPEVTIGLQLEPPTLDLTSSPAAAIPQVLLYNVYETLVKLEADGSITGLLAESWDLNDDGTVYTFHLRDGVTFHNGKPLTADDVVFSLEHVLTKEPAHPFATTLAPIESVTAVDDSTVEVTLSRFSSNLLFFLTQGQGVILDEGSIDSIENAPVGTGPFAFVSWTVGDSIVLERNLDYWGEPAPLDTVTFRYINDPNALNNALLAGDIDIIAGVSAPELLSVFEDDPAYIVYTGLTNGEVTLAINGANPPLDDVRVRQAISYAIDRQAVIDLAYFGYGVPIGSHASPLDPYYEDLTGVYAYDPDTARQLLADAGVTDLTLRLFLPPVSYARRGGEIVASQLEDVGIGVEINNVEWGVWLEDVFTNHDYDLSIVAHVEPRDIGQYGNPDYYWEYDNPQVAEWLAEADAEPDDAARYELYRKVQEQITADAANAWLFLLPALSVTKAGITGYEADLPGLSLDITKLAFNP
jgi:peptide/nickel transport system substrate-binding protein